jgi:hypothetical protein
MSLIHGEQNNFLLESISNISNDNQYVTYYEHRGLFYIRISKEIMRRYGYTSDKIYRINETDIISHIALYNCDTNNFPGNQILTGAIVYQLMTEHGLESIEAGIEEIP